MNKEKIKEICEQYEFWNNLDENSKNKFVSETIIEKYSKKQIKRSFTKDKNLIKKRKLNQNRISILLIPKPFLFFTS